MISDTVMHAVSNDALSDNELDAISGGEMHCEVKHFSFLGYTFGPHYMQTNGRWYLGASPSKKSVQRVKGKVGEILVPGNQAPWTEVRDRPNGLLRGWRAYFNHGSRQRAYGDR